jgi:hypothetical protein
MNEKQLSQICLGLTIISLIILIFSYKPDFEEKTIKQILETPNSKGKIMGRVEHVIKNYPITLFTLTDGTTATIYYPKPITLEKNDFVSAYVENQGQQSLFAQKVVKE